MLIQSLKHGVRIEFFPAHFTQPCGLLYLIFSAWDSTRKNTISYFFRREEDCMEIINVFCMHTISFFKTFLQLRIGYIFFIYQKKKLPLCLKATEYLPSS